VLFPSKRHVLITYTGGVFASKGVRRAFARHAPCEPARLPPVQGAGLIARQLLQA